MEDVSRELNKGANAQGADASGALGGASNSVSDSNASTSNGASNGASASSNASRSSTSNTASYLNSASNAHKTTPPAKGPGFSLASSISDFLSLRMLALSLLPFIIAIIILYLGGYCYLGDGLAWLLKLGASHRLDAYIDVISVRGSYEVVPRGFLGHLILVCLYVLYFTLLVFFAMIIQMLASFIYLPAMLLLLQRWHFKGVALAGDIGVGRSLAKTLKTLAIFIALFLICSPLYFIPIIGYVVLLLVYFYYYKESMMSDIALAILDTKEFRVFKRRYIRNYALLFSSYLLSIIPIIGFMLINLQYIIFARYVFTYASKERAK